MTSGPQIAAEAMALVGRPFRLYGRDPATGLDCVGLVAASLNRAGIEVHPPLGYRLRNRDIRPYLEMAGPAGLVPVSGLPCAGDIVLARPAPWHHHLLIAGQDRSFIHAHAGLGRVVALPGPLPWPVLHHWRYSRKD